MKKIKNKAYAKINLHLDVLSRYEDGYHEVNTVMQSLSLCDDIEIEINESDRNKINIICDAPNIPIDNKNIVWRATELFLDSVQDSRNWDIIINITKRIPVEAGLGGGSADAAATLCGLNALFGEPLCRERMIELGALLGADVPFCMIGGCAYADGKGYSFSELPSLPPCYVVVARGGDGVSTPWAYRMLDERFGGFSDGSYLVHDKKMIINCLQNGDLRGIGDNLYNIFEEAILSERPIAKRLKAIMLENGAMGSIMSGSGTAVFGIFENETDARKVSLRIDELGYFSSVSVPTNKYF